MFSGELSRFMRELKSCGVLRGIRSEISCKMQADEEKIHDEAEATHLYAKSYVRKYFMIQNAAIKCEVQFHHCLFDFFGCVCVPVCIMNFRLESVMLCNIQHHA